MNAFHRGTLVVAALLAPACSAPTFAGHGPVAPGRSSVEPEVARGYEAYEARLSAWGTWTPDADYGVRWCPRADVAGDGFQPYLHRGHWAASQAPVGKAPAGSPVWVSEDQDTWGEITTHHGWWVQAADASQRWCWVPGVAETPARVLWRTGDDFVGWAPEPPAWVALDDVEVDHLDWVYTLLGSLLDLTIQANTLRYEAGETARQATAASIPAGGFARPRTGPSAAQVGAARKALIDYARSNAPALAQGVSQLPRGITAGTSSGGSGSSGSSKSGSSSSDGSGSSSRTRTMELVPLPPALAFYDAFLLAPPPGPMGNLFVREQVGAGSHEGHWGSATAAVSTGGAHGRTAGSRLVAGRGSYGAPSSSSPATAVEHPIYSYSSSSHSSGSSGSRGSSHGSSSGRSHGTPHVSVGGGSFRIHR